MSDKSSSNTNSQTTASHVKKKIDKSILNQPDHKKTYRPRQNLSENQLGLAQDKRNEVVNVES